jgi:hypothetical protein
MQHTEESRARVGNGDGDRPRSGCGIASDPVLPLTPDEVARLQGPVPGDPLLHRLAPGQRTYQVIAPVNPLWNHLSRRGLAAPASTEGEDIP